MAFLGVASLIGVLKSYIDGDQRLREVYANPDEWMRKPILDVAGSGKFSSDNNR
jgi:glycogen phosphorylase